jgi:hypothetical protein
VGAKKWGNSSKESMKDKSEIHFLTKKQAPIPIDGTGALVCPESEVSPDTIILR